MSGQPGQPAGHTTRKSREALRLAGTFRRDRHADPASTLPSPEARSAAETPAAVPEGLSAAAARLWTMFTTAYVLSEPQREILCAGLRAYDVAASARCRLTVDGLVVDGPSGIKPHPCVAAFRDANAQWVSTLRVLGFAAPEE